MPGTRMHLVDSSGKSLDAQQVTLLDAVTAAGDGTWMGPYSEYSVGLVELSGLVTTTVVLYVQGSNAVTVPTSTAHGVTLYTSLTSANIGATSTGFLTIDPLPVWLKVRCTVGTTTAALTAVGILRRA